MYITFQKNARDFDYVDDKSWALNWKKQSTNWKKKKKLLVQAEWLIGR
jgi:hypothetical protein